MMHAGKRKCKLVIQSVDTTPTETGGTADTTSTVVTLFAAIEPLNATELYRAKMQQATTTHKITIPYVAGITPNMRGIYDSRTFNFETVVNVGELNRELEIMATELK